MLIITLNRDGEYKCYNEWSDNDIKESESDNDIKESDNDIKESESDNDIKESDNDMKESESDNDIKESESVDHLTTLERDWEYKVATTPCCFSALQFKIIRRIAILTRMTMTSFHGY